ncbi:FAD-dependent oxidoreductase [Roseovarius sp. SCSIO 43702]|uniref:NAD(P)/FAD-dependent oxidoreductase n=1 Tax=Roseovarius sp. SCSIO 43702 TaxID=2823043 RepID=UPI001C72CF38|nr:FAD-dependent oxidoreductase [Roseovarius sp. SCSIO 43702]QYX57290.1 FAD-dependent oxidoreductase [Roseovarius sp. SCSIO 43702]
MSRIYPAHAYGPAPRANCYWPTTAAPVEVPRAEGELAADVIVVGAGFTGLSCALRMAEAGADVVVLEAEYPGWGASGRNGGFCCLGGSAASDEALRRTYGEDARKEWCRAELASVAFAQELMARHGMEVDAHSEGESLMAHTRKAADGFEARARQLEEDYGVAPTITPEAELAQNGMKGPFFAALNLPIGQAVNPVKYVNGLARAAMNAGVRIYGQSPVQGIEGRDGYTVTTPQATVRAGRLVMATNGYSSDDLPEWMRARYLPTQSNVIVTRPMTDEELRAQGWTTNQMCYDDRFFLHYFRLMPNNRMLFGMRAGLRCSPQGDAHMLGVIKGHFDRMFPAWSHVEVEHYWNGLLSISWDRTPYTGPIPEMPDAFVSMSYHGNGVAMASYAGALLGDQVMGRSGKLLHPEIMKRPPERMPLGPFRRKLMWPLYAWATLRGD